MLKNIIDRLGTFHMVTRTFSKRHLPAKLSLEV
jgi:hypothetical protein